MESHPNGNTVFKNAGTAEKQALTENQGRHRNIHRVTDVSI